MSVVIGIVWTGFVLYWMAGAAGMVDGRPRQSNGWEQTLLPLWGIPFFLIRVDPAGNAQPTDEPVDDFTVTNLGVQLRYRFEIAPLSYLYVVYGRGGFRNEPRIDGSASLLGDSFSLRDDEQLLVKFSYRFEK
jgi:hypothetical protein